MMKITLTTDVEPGDGLIGYLESQREILGEIMQEVENEIAPYALAELQADVPPVKYPIQWTSEKQRRAFFATDGFGGGIPTQRTGKLQRSWLVYVTTLDEGFGFIIENTSPVSKFVYGSLAQDRSAALRFQQRFHANTGWQPATDTAAFWLDAADELATQKLDDRLGDFARLKPQRRAYTSGTRR